MTSRVSPKTCSLHAVLAERELCPGADCAFWEADACTIERLELHRLRNAELARHLLELRGRLAEARAEAEVRDAPRRFAQLLNLNRE
jgi:hypothetical protein